MLLNLQQVSTNAFRWLVLALLISIIFDLVYLSLSTSPKSGGASSFMGSLLTFIAFLFRVLMLLVYWKDSLDFDNLMMGKQVDRAIRVISA
jgi:hypothetical protein